MTAFLRTVFILNFIMISCVLYAQQPPGVPVVISVDPKLQALHQQALDDRKTGDLLKSRDIYREMIIQYPQASDINDLQKELWDLNLAIIASPIETHQSEIYTIEPGDTLGKIARKFGTTIELIKRRNHLEHSRIIAGHTLSVWLGAFSIVIDKSENTLTFKNGDEVVKIYPVSTGKNNSSPVGEFTIKDRYADPVWFHKGDVVAARDPKNFLGTRWLGFDLPKYGIHGTIEPERIGKQVSSGCIRMRNEDVQELYDFVPIGTRVTITE